MKLPLALGIDFGTDSVRALLVETTTGQEIASAESAYARWATGAFCDAAQQRFRQHPQDHLDAMRLAVRGALAKAPRGSGQRVCGIGIDTTGSSPLPIAADGTALALTKAFAGDPDALCILWKDHTSVAEADEINTLAHGGQHRDYTAWSGGISNSEWFWAKILHITRTNAKVAKAAHSWVEHCDWIPAVLCGLKDPRLIRRSRCAAGHKAMWHASWQGLPDARFLGAFDGRLATIRERLYVDTYTAGEIAGLVSAEWAEAFGVPVGVPVSVGAFDAHLGAVGAGARPFDLVKVMGTSTCDMLMVPPQALGSQAIPGICGQVDGSIMPGCIGLEAGQSAFGDVYAWWRKTLFAGVQLSGASGGNADHILPALTAAAERLAPGAGGLVALDWFNGRRTPDADARVRAAISGLHLGHEPAHIFRALIEATAFGARAIADRFADHGIPVKRLVALGGIARKSPLVMQICADVLQRPIAIVASDQCCALGAAIAGAVAGGAHSSMAKAQRIMASKIERTVRPNAKVKRTYHALYARYQALGQLPGKDD